MADNLLGDFLRARRELVTPEQAGVPVLGRRRVPGLRREEVAMLAGISGEYYLRLEQGKYRNPSVQILEALARVLRLDDESLEHLLGLGTEQPRRRPVRRGQRETVPPGILKFLDGLGMPAFVEGRHLDVLAANPLAAAVSPRLVAGRNRLLDVFLDPDEREMFPQWELVTEFLVAVFRRSVGTEEDPRSVELVGQLSLASPRFRRLWARHEVRGKGGARTVLNHPVVGELTLNREKLLVGEAPHLTVAVYHADRGSADADKLALLALQAEGATR